MSIEQLYHVTILSNLARAYDKYSRSYCKAHIPESRFPDRFFLLTREELAIGIAKTRLLLDKTRLDGDRLLVLEISVESDELQPNPRTGVGCYVERNRVPVDALYSIGHDMSLIPVRIEEAIADSVRVLTPSLLTYDELRPRSVSILPVAIGCQAACPFCFSKASASADQETKPIDWMRVEHVLAEGRRRGAERAVITGGGEPGLLPLERLTRLVRECAAALPKVVLITNGYFLQRLPDGQRAAAMREFAAAGLSVLSVSRHHWDNVRNAEIMRLDTHRLLAATCPAELRLRLVCVLQRGGVDSPKMLAGYLDWAVSLGVTEFTFKELYVSTSQESVYHSYEANSWSYSHQVPLKLVLDFAQANHWVEAERLPWGAPVFRGAWRGRTISVAAYTEPSLFWERAHGVARSWNLMADGRCLASLEDRASEVCGHGLPAIPCVA